MPAERKKELYRCIKASGLALFIPVAMLTGPIAAFFVSRFLDSRLGESYARTAALIAVGFIAALFETIKVVKTLIKTGAEK